MTERLAAHPMRVLNCYSGNMYGGVESLLTTLARCRAMAPGLDLAFALCFEGRLADELREAGVAVELLGAVRFSHPWTVLAARRRLTVLLERARPDVVLCHSAWPHALMASVARKAGLPVVFWQHDLASGQHWLERRASQTPPDLVLANSRTTAETTSRLFPETPVEVLYCPVPAPELGLDRASTRAEVRASLETPDNAVVVVQASRLERWKGQSLLIDALGQLRERPDWVAWIAGGAQRPPEQVYLNELRARVEALGITDRVRFLGQRSDVPRLLAAADIHCQPNTSPEPFGIAFVEALYAGLPLVSTRMGGAAEIINEACGVLVEPAEPSALAEALGRLMADPSERVRLGEAGPERARWLSDPATVLDRLRDFLAAVLEKSKGLTARV